MAEALVSKKKAQGTSLALFLVGLAILSYTQQWWPEIMLVIGIPLATRQLLLGKIYDMGVTLFVFGGVFLTIAFDISWEILLPVLFTTGGIYIFFRDWIESKSSLAEEEENMNKEIEEQTKKRPRKSKATAKSKQSPKKTPSKAAKAKPADDVAVSE